MGEGQGGGPAPFTATFGFAQKVRELRSSLENRELRSSLENRELRSCLENRELRSSLEN